ncbi:hypothetical protein LAZ67_2005382, partial [Cordylochernes scorpioides]
MLNNGPISWCSEKQNCVSLSTTESEYITTSKRATSRTSKAYNNLLRQSCIRLVHNPEYHKRTKRIDILYHFIRDQFQKHAIDLLYVCSNDQAADIFTKALPPERYRRLRSQLGLFETTKNDLDGVEEADRYPDGFKVTLTVTVSGQKQPPVSAELPWEGLDQINPKPNILFSSQEEMDNCTAQFSNIRPPTNNPPLAPSPPPSTKSQILPVWSTSQTMVKLT